MFKTTWKGLIPLLFRRILAFALCVALLTAGSAALASEREEIVTSEYVTIEGAYCVVDSLYGVDAIYSVNTSYFQCWEYVTRFYEQVFGITVGYDGSSAPVSGSSEYWFESTTTPRPGDIAFASAERRGSYNHWAIVKSYDAESGTITLIEQNYDWNGAAEVNRTLTFPSSYYEVFTLCSADGAVEPVIDITQYENADESDETETTEAMLVLLSAAEQTLDISGEYSDYVLPYAKQASAIGMEIRLEGYTEEIDADTFCGLILQSLTVSDYDITYVNALPEGTTENLAIAYAMGIVDDAMLANPTVTREQAAIIMQRLVRYLGVNVTYDLTEVVEFEDFSSISAEAVPAIAEMVEMEIMAGSTLYGAYTFQPTVTMTYEQALTMVMRLYNYVPEVIVSSVAVEAAASVPENLDMILPSE